MMALPEESNGNNMVTLELTSSGTDEIGSVRKIEQGDTGIRLIVTLPKLIDGEQANLSAALLFQHLDRLPRDAVIERVKITGLHFTEEGVVGIEGFLSLHASTIKQVSLKGMMSSGYNRNEAVAFASLAKVFQSSCTLETLNLSDNTICASLWKNLSMHRSLRQLILDYVEMDDDSVVELQNNFNFGETLEELYVVLTNQIGERGLGAANAMLRSCKKLSSLRWAQKDAPPEALMPWHGLSDMASNGRVSTLLHLVMDGGDLLECPSGDARLYNALRFFPKLRTLKLRATGVTDEHVRRIVDSLLFSCPPLEVIDMSKNHIKAGGALDLSRLSSAEPMRKNLVMLGLDRNKIDAGGARAILEAFATPANNQRLEVKLEFNSFNFGKLAFNVARRKAQAEMERDELQIHLMQAQTMLESSHGSILSKPETHKLHEEISKLREEKASLLKVLAIVSGSNHREDVTKTLDRISGLEQAVYGPNQLPDEAKRIKDGHGTQTKLVRSKGTPSAEPQHGDMKNSSGRMKHRPRNSTSSQVSSPSRKSTKGDLPSPRGSNSVGNVLIRGISERWGSPPQKKKGLSMCVNQSPVLHGHKLRLSTKPPVESETSHSRGSTSSSPRSKDKSGSFSTGNALDHSANSGSYSSARN